MLQSVSEAITKGAGMFGTNDNQAIMGSPTVQNPSMLDNVSSDDFKTVDEAETTQAATPQQASTNDSTAQATTSSHTLTTDNPFVQNPIAGPAADSTQGVSATVPEPSFSTIPSSAPSPSAPVDPPVVEAEEVADNKEHDDYLSAIGSHDDGAETPDAPVDHEKLADMKQEALAHLEPLADHIEGTPEERFKTTMMMIQANDNHTLLDKALDAAKAIEDDKIRAQALLDIINEINYFSQVKDN